MTTISECELENQKANRTMCVLRNNRPRVRTVIMRSQYFLKNWRIVCWLNPTISQEDIMLKKGVLALALVIGMPVFAAEHWIDVRVPEEYQQQHIQGAVNIPLKR